MPNEPILLGGQVFLSTTAQASAPVRIYNETTGNYKDTTTDADGFYLENIWDVDSELTIGDVFYIESRDGVNQIGIRWTSTALGSSSQNLTVVADASPNRSV